MNDNIKTANITLKECLQQVEVLASKSECFIDELPEVLKEDFNLFIRGHTISVKDNRSITYDMKMYYNKIINKGISYQIQWEQ